MMPFGNSLFFFFFSLVVVLSCWPFFVVGSGVFFCVFFFFNALVCVALSHLFFLFRIFSSHSTQPQQEVAQKWQSRKKKKTVRFKEGERKKKKVDSFNLALSSLSLNVKAELCWERKQFPFFFFKYLRFVKEQL